MVYERGEGDFVRCPELVAHIRILAVPAVRNLFDYQWGCRSDKDREYHGTTAELERFVVVGGVGVVSLGEPG